MATAQGSIRIPLARKGEDGEDTVSLEPSTGIVTFSEDTTSVQVTFRAYQGTTQIYVGNIWPSGEVPGVTVYGTQGSDNLSYVYTFTRTDPSIDIDAQVDFTANISGGTLTESVERTRTLHFISVKPGEDGEGAYYLKPDKDTVVFTPESNTAQVTFTAYCGSEKIGGRDPYVRADTRLDGVSYSFGSVSGGTFTMTLARTDDTVQVNGTMVVCMEVDLPDDDTMDISGSVAVLTNDGTPDAQLSTDVVCFKESGSQFVYVTGTRGGMQVSLSESQLSVSPSSGAVWDVTKAQVGQRVELEVAYSGGAAKAAVDEEVTVTTTIGGVDIVKTFRVQTNFDGDPGKDGDPGEDAVTYELDCPVTAITYKTITATYTPTSFTATLYKVTGDVREMVEGDIYVYMTPVGGSEAYLDGQMDVRSYTIVIANFADKGFPSEYRVYGRVGSTELNKIITVSSSYMLRGPQRWEDVEDGFGFQTGNIGETYHDIVVHGYKESNDLGFYECILTHVKGCGGDEPVYGMDTRYWKQTNYLQSLATDLLLTDYASIRYLFVDDLFMVGQVGCLWINPDLEGMRINPVSVLDSAERGDQDATAAAWENPLAEFSARNLPSIEDIFGDNEKDISGTFNAQTLVENDDVSRGYVYYPGDPEGDFLRSMTLSGLSEGDIVAISVEPGALVRLTEGAEIDGGYSSATVGIGVSFTASSNYWDIIALGYGTTPEVNATREFEIEPRYTLTAPATSARVYVRLYCDCGLNYGAKVELASAITVRVQTTRYGYVARYCANGMFVGLSSQDYLRFITTEDSSGVVNGASLQLKAGNQGLDISADGAMQTIGAVSMPIGGMLLSGYVWMDGSTPSGYFNTWDGIMPTLRRTSLGIYQIIIPTEWADKIGVMSPWTFSVSVQGRGSDGNVNAYVTNVDPDGKIQVGISRQSDDGSIARADLPFYIQVTYVGHGSIIRGTS